MRRSATGSFAVDTALLFAAQYTVSDPGIGRDHVVSTSAAPVYAGPPAHTAVDGRPGGRGQIHTRSSGAGLWSDIRVAARVGEAVGPMPRPAQSAVAFRKRRCFRWPDEVKIALCIHLEELNRDSGPGMSHCAEELARRVSRDLGYTVRYTSLRNLRYNLPGRIRAGKESARVVEAFRLMEQSRRRARACPERDSP